MARARYGPAFAAALSALGYPLIIHVAGCDRPSPRPPSPPASTQAVASTSASASDPAPALVARSAPPCSSLPPVDTPPAIGSTGLATPGLSPGLPAGAGPALRAACARFEAARARNIRTYPGYRKPGFWTDDSYQTIGRCFASPRGAWVVEQSAFRSHREPHWTSERARWALLYLSPEGKVTRGEQAQGEIVVVLGEMDGNVEVLGVHDFDGDGAAEVLLRVWSYAAIDGARFSLATYTLRDGVIVPWGPGDGALAWVDLDRDGRPELLGQGPYPLVDIPRVAHSLPGGAFSHDDDVVRSALRQACPAPPAGPLRGDREVLCSRLWGVSGEEVERRVLDAGMEAGCTGELIRRARKLGPAPVLSGACPLASAGPATSSACGPSSGPPGPSGP